MTDVGTLTVAEFLLARIAEDEAAARIAEHADGPTTLGWRRGGRRYLSFDNGRSERYESVFAGNWDRILVARDDGSVAAHIARHDPARVLAECEAKRATIKWALTVIDLPDEGWQDDHDQAFATYAAQRALEALALPYADHPDYREAWRP